MGKTSRGRDELKKRLTRSPTKKIPFARVFADQYHSPEFLALSRSARLLYVDFLIASGGETEYFIFPRRDHKHIPPQTFTRAKDELKRAGFILERAYFKTESQYKISSDWMRTQPIKEPAKRAGGRKNLKLKS